MVSDSVGDYNFYNLLIYIVLFAIKLMRMAIHKQLKQIQCCMIKKSKIKQVT